MHGPSKCQAALHASTQSVGVFSMSRSSAASQIGSTRSRSEPQSGARRPGVVRMTLVFTAWSASQQRFRLWRRRHSAPPVRSACSVHRHSPIPAPPLSKATSAYTQGHRSLASGPRICGAAIYGGANDGDYTTGRTDFGSWGFSGGTSVVPVWCQSPRRSR